MILLKQTGQTHNYQHHSATSKTKKQRYGLLKLTNSCSKLQIRHCSQTKSKKPLYIQLKITSKIRIIDMHEGHIMKKTQKKSGLHKSPFCIFQSHIIHRVLTGNTWQALLTYRTCLQTPIHTCIHTKKHIKNNILTQDLEANSFYFKEFDVFISLCQVGN